jgi:uracil-DNA glycosylase family protein
MTARRGAQLRGVAADAARCERCPLFARATQTVFGAGSVGARLFLIGEQPGDREDRAGAPFVGPAGRVLDDALEAAGIERASVYVTNAVKHCKWSPRGKRRIHERPNRAEVVACRPWLDQELALVAPVVIVALGATAGQALWGSSFRVGTSRGKVLDLDGRTAIATIHPSAVLRAADAAARHAQQAVLVDDLRVAADLSAA